MTIYSVKDVRDVYPSLQDLARLNTDDGDDVEGRPPYHISPEDLDIYYKPGDGDKIPPIEINGRRLTIFEIVELYRQLVYHDKNGSANGVENGKIEASQLDKAVVLPRHSKGHHYWGRQWTPAKRLSRFLAVYGDFFAEIMAQTNFSFPNAESYTEGNVNQNNLRVRRLYKSEKGEVENLAREMGKKGFVGYDEMLKDSLKYMRVLEVYVPAELRDRAHMESKSFGYTHLFAIGEIPSVYMIAYPQFGQKNSFFNNRLCKLLKTEDGRKIRRCMPLVGLNDRRTVMNYFLAPYCRGEDVTRGKPEEQGYVWARMAYYLRKARVYNYFRYDIKLSQKTFFKALLLHEALHFRNSNPPLLISDFFASSSVVKGFLKMIKDLKDPYEKRHLQGAYYVFLQRVAMEGSIVTRRRLRERFKIVRMKGGNPSEDAIYRDIETRLHFLDQLSILAEDAEERLVEDEVYALLFDPRKLREVEEIPPRDMVLNPNELGEEGLLMREEKRWIREEEKNRNK